jgi:hypothetical protein
MPSATMEERRERPATFRRRSVRRYRAAPLVNGSPTMPRPDPAQMPKEPRWRAERRQSISILLDSMPSVTDDVRLSGGVLRQRVRPSTPRPEDSVVPERVIDEQTGEQRTELRPWRDSDDPRQATSRYFDPKPAPPTVGEPGWSDRFVVYPELGEVWPSVTEAAVPSEERVVPRALHRNRDQHFCNGSYEELTRVLERMKSEAPELHRRIGPIGEPGARDQDALDWISARMTQRIVVPPWLRAKRPGR